MSSWFSWFTTPADEGGESTEEGDSNRSDSAESTARTEEGQLSSAAQSTRSSADAKSASSRNQNDGNDQAADGGAEEGDGGDAGGGEDSEDKDDDEKVRLSESTRLKGYITFAVASAIHYDSADNSDLHIEAENLPETDDILESIGGDNSLVYPADKTQRRYAMAVSMVTLIISLFCIIVHFDRFTCLKKAWIKAFKPKSKIELGLLLGLLVWWLFATWILTSITGIAGAGKGHYNLYFSTWVCLWTCFWTLERWLVASGQSSVTAFMESWPNRAPAWIVMFILSIGSMLSMLDLFLNWDKFNNPSPLYFMYSAVGKHAWEWLIFVPAFTIPISAGFFTIELFRVTKSDSENTKSDRENMFEGLCIATLACFWIPSLFIATTPGGAASLVGNAYFFTWGTTIIVTETFLWWVRDWRKGVYAVVRMQQEEYRRAQMLVLKKHKEEVDTADSADDVQDDTVVDTADSEHRVTFLEGDVAAPADNDSPGNGSDEEKS